MTRLLHSGLAALAATALLSVLLSGPAVARPLVRIHMPNINVGKAVGAALYPVGKTVVNGGKTVLKTTETAVSLAPKALDTAVKIAPAAMGGAANLAPSRWSGAAQKYVVQKVVAGVVKR